MNGTEHRLRLQVANLVLSARSQDLPGPLGVEPHVLPFLTRRPPDLDLVFRRGRFPDPEASLVFDSGGVWRLYRYADESLRYDLADPLFGDEPYAQALVDPALREGEVRLRTLRGHRRGGTLYPFVYPLDEVLTITLLSKCGGLHVHAAGIDDHGLGLLFPGVSGAGKTTISRLWAGERGVRVLSDDRNVLRPCGGGAWLHGTPWHGEANLSAPGQARLRGVFFLDKAERSVATSMRPSEAAAELLARSFPAYWDAAGVSEALRAADRVVSCVPCYRLRFRPDAGAVDAVREVLG